MDDTTDKPQPDEPAAATDQFLGSLTRRQILVATAAVGMLPASSASANPIQLENQKTPGSPRSAWDITSANTGTEGFATRMSVNRGENVDFKIKSNRAYRIDIYRLGYYAGNGGRLVHSIPSLPIRSQPAALTNAATGLIDAGNWSVAASWAVPPDAVSGVYVAKLTGTDGRTNQIVFVVRDDSQAADIVFQTSDTTWQAYNPWGGNSLYTGAPAGRAYKVSYNRPFRNRFNDTTGTTGSRDFFFDSDYPLLRWFEANGYNVTYVSGLDTHLNGARLRQAKVFVSVGHDEYWSGPQRANVEAARDAGVHLAFLSGNEVFWKTRWEPSIDGPKTPNRTLVCYKETHANAKIDPTPAWTGTWRDPRFSPPADGGRPENALTGTIFTVNDGSLERVTVPAAEGKLRFWRNTSIANLGPGQVATLTGNDLTYEWDEDLDNGFRPPRLIRLTSTTDTNADVIQDYGSTYARGTATHAYTLYHAPSGAKVFASGAGRTAWNFSNVHDLSLSSQPAADLRVQQAMVNLLADMGVQPVTLQAGLVPATASTDTTPPTSTITAPAAGANLTVGNSVVIAGTAADSGGIVAAVEVSTDGATWRRANGRSSWSYNWTPSAAGTVTIRSRALDDSLNLESPGPGVTVTVTAGAGGTSTLWPASATPAQVTDNDPSAVELGVKFRAATNGTISAIRFYKGPQNTGLHTGSLWTAAGTLLASATFTDETASGWQQVNLVQPVLITAGQTYVASYHTSVGYYSADVNYFAASRVSGALTAPASASSGGNGVYAYGPSGVFPTSSYAASNYWVDVVFNS
jgi:hypothetical protein